MQYTFDFNMADSVRDHMATTTKNIISMLENLHSQVSASLANWESGARDEYNRAKTEWDAAAAQMPESLGRAELALNEISSGYLAVEHWGAGRWLQ